MNRVSAIEAALAFDGRRLAMARELGAIRKSDLARLMGKSPTAVAAWETGVRIPTAANVAQLSLALGVDPGFFAARSFGSDLTQTRPQFRSLRSTTQIARDQATAFGRLSVEISESLERHVELPDPDVPEIPASLDLDDSDPARAAHQIRASWSLGTGPLGHLVRLVEHHGVLVVFSPPRTASIDAYSFSTATRPVVVLNPLKRDYYRQRFDLAHELGHLVMHSEADPGGRQIEDEANTFASELLMPAAAIESSLPRSMGKRAWVELAQLKEQWGVSIQSLLYRARALGCLSDMSYRNAMITVSSRGWRREEPGLVKSVEQPSLLARAVEILSEAGIAPEQLIDECRVSSELFEIATSRSPKEPDGPQSDPATGFVAPLIPLNRFENGDHHVST